MKHITTLLILVFLFNIQNTLACSFAGGSLFKPTMNPWEKHPGPAQEGGEGDYWEPLPAPVVKVTNVTRGSVEPGSSCFDAGTISLAISLPEESTYSIEEFGFYFRVKRGRSPDAIFPNVPVIGNIKRGTSRILFAWLDGHPSQQIELDLEVDVFLVTCDLSIGPSTLIGIKADIGKQSERNR